MSRAFFGLASPRLLQGQCSVTTIVYHYTRAKRAGVRESIGNQPDRNRPAAGKEPARIREGSGQRPERIRPAAGAPSARLSARSGTEARPPAFLGGDRLAVPPLTIGARPGPKNPPRAISASSGGFSAPGERLGVRSEPHSFPGHDSAPTIGKRRSRGAVGARGYPRSPRPPLSSSCAPRVR